MSTPTPGEIVTAVKAYVALAGAIATALLGVFAAGSPVGVVLTFIVAVATAVGVYQAPRTRKARTNLGGHNAHA